MQHDSTPKGFMSPRMVISFIQTNEIQILPFNFPSIEAFPANDFRSIGFTHHYNILAGCKSREERLFYISLCAREHLTPDGISNCIKQNLYAAKGQLPNNFLQKLPSGSLAKRAILAFKDQYMVEFVIQKYDSPMGVATYKTSADMPEELRKALPDEKQLKELLSGTEF